MSINAFMTTIVTRKEALSRPMQSNQIYAVYGQEGRQMTLDVLRAADVAALIPKRDADIVIKPNLVVARPAEGGATTHVSVIEGIIDYLKENGFTRISIIDPPGWGTTPSVHMSCAATTS